MQAVAYLLLLLVEHLMREFLPREPQITGHRHHPEPHGTARREHDRQVGHVPTGDRRRDLLVRQVARGGNVRHRHTGHPAGRPRLRKVHLQKRSVPAPKPAEGVQGFDDTRPLRPAAAHAGGEGHNGRFAAGKGREACLPKRRLVARSWKDHIGIIHVFERGGGGKPVLRQADPPVLQVGANLLVLHLIEAEVGQQAAKIGRRPPPGCPREEPVEERVHHPGELGLRPTGGPEGVEFGPPRRR